jgi:hypothetical protein
LPEPGTRIVCDGNFQSTIDFWGLFEVKPVPNLPPGTDPAAVAAFQGETAEAARRLNGDPARQNLSEPETLSISGRVWAIRAGHWETRQMPTATQRRDLEIATAGLDALERDLNTLIAGDLAKLEEAFAAAGAPWTPGRRVP